MRFRRKFGVGHGYIESAGWEGMVGEVIGGVLPRALQEQ